jgi:hypothetical protein
MGLMSGRSVVTILIIILGLAYMVMLQDDLITIKADDYACSTGRHWYAVGAKQRFFAVGRLNLFYQPIAFGCEIGDRYQPSQYHMLNGVLVGN